MERRDFLKRSCAFCLGGSVLIPFLESCGTIPIFNTVSKDKTVNVPLEKFGKHQYLIVRPSNIRYDIAVIKHNETEYKSYVMICTHADNMLRFNGNEFSCSMHGSTFDMNGNVQKGPAERPLRTLETRVADNSLSIKIP